MMTARKLTGEAVNGDRRCLADEIPLATPYAVTMFPIYACNFKCKYCIHSLAAQDRDVLSNCISMDFKLYKKCINDMKQFPQRLKVLHFIGYGEPLLHPDIVNMVQYAVNQNVADAVDIVSNGSLLTHRLSDGLIAAGLTRLRISLQGLSNEAYKVRSGVILDFAGLYHNLQYFYEHRGETKVHIKLIDIGLSEEEKERFFTLFQPITDTIALENMVPVVKNIDYSKAGKKEFKEKQFGGCVEDIQICPQPFYFIQIAPDGKCVPCCSTKIPAYMGDITKDSIVDIWNGQEFYNFRMMQLQKKKGINPVCAECTQYKYSIFQEDILDSEADHILVRMKSNTDRK